jgi:hypothetical protein
VKDATYTAGARRFDMAERDHFISMEMAAVGMEMMARWGSPAIVGRLSVLTDRPPGVRERARGSPPRPRAHQPARL